LSDRGGIVKLKAQSQRRQHNRQSLIFNPSAKQTNTGATPMTTYFSGDASAQQLTTIDTVIQATVGVDLEIKLPDWAANKTYVITNGPVGLTIGLKTGVIRWCPTPDQAVTHTVAFSDGLGSYSVTVAVAANPAFVLPANCGWVSNVGTGAGATPQASASDARAFRGAAVDRPLGRSYNSTKTVIYFRGGTYPKGSENRRMIAGERPVRDLDLNNVEYRPWGNERPLMRIGESPFRNQAQTDNVIIDGIAARGDSDKYIYDEALAGWWTAPSLLNSNGFAIGGTNVTVRNCVVHEIMGQCIAFKSASDVIAENNIVANGAALTTAGTCGTGFVTMLGSNKPVTEYANKMTGNTFFNIESRMISRVFLKGEITMGLDEGSINIFQIGNAASDTSNPYLGRTLVENNVGFNCGKGLVSNGMPRVDFNRNAVIDCGTTIMGTSKGLRANKSSDNKFTNNICRTITGFSGNLGSVYSFAHDLDANGNPQNGYIRPFLERNYGNASDGKEPGNSLTVTPNLFANPSDPFDVTPHPSIPAGVGPDPAHHKAQVERARSYSVDITPKEHWKVQNLTTQTRTIFDFLPTGMSLDTSTWQNALPYIDAAGVSRPDFDVTVTESIPGTFAQYGIPGTTLKMKVLYTFPRP
jgi:hypothetical protein